MIGNIEINNDNVVVDNKKNGNNHMDKYDIKAIHLDDTTYIYYIKKENNNITILTLDSKHIKHNDNAKLTNNDALHDEILHKEGIYNCDDVINSDALNIGSCREYINVSYYSKSIEYIKPKLLYKLKFVNGSKLNHNKEFYIEFVGTKLTTNINIICHYLPVDNIINKDNPIKRKVINFIDINNDNTTNSNDSKLWLSWDIESKVNYILTDLLTEEYLINNFIN